MIDPKIKQKGYGFATYPSVKLYSYKSKTPSGNKKRGFIKELLFGDYIRPLFKNGDFIPLILGKKKYIKVKARGRYGYILESGIQAERVLEVNFLDVAQGDCCHIVTTANKHIVIDAGKGSNMFRFFSWRFNLRKPDNFPPQLTAIITHSDADHYGGFTPLFTAQKKNKNLFTFDKIYHNGIVEESGRKVSTLGTLVEESDEEYITDLCESNADYIRRSNSVNKAGNYIKMLRKTDVPKQALCYGDPPIYDQDNMKIEVLGPFPQEINGKKALPVFLNNKGKTKNGHSIILKLTIGKLRLLLGGDLNSAAEDYLFSCFTGVDMKALVRAVKSGRTSNATKEKAQKKIDDAIEKARAFFEVDIAKSCHHGSPDFTSEFLSVINPIATVISSGDEESYCHPRPDTLGTIGKHSRGERSLIFSTELARSSKEFIETSKLSTLKKKERIVTVYGMINVRTDGEKAIIAQKLEKPGASKSWDIHKLEWNKKTKEFEYKDYHKRK